MQSILIPCIRPWWLLRAYWRIRGGLRQCITTMRLLGGLLLHILLLLFLLYICYLQDCLLLFFCAILEGIFRRSPNIKRIFRILSLLSVHRTMTSLLLSTCRTIQKKRRINNKRMCNQQILMKKYSYFLIETPIYFTCLENATTPVSLIKLLPSSKSSNVY